MIAVNLPLNTSAATAFSRVFSINLASASCSTIRARIKLNVVAAIPSYQSSTPIAAFQSESTRVRRDVSRSDAILSWVAHSNALTITDGGIEGRPFSFEYN
jgi:hypothetical protein